MSDFTENETGSGPDAFYQNEKLIYYTKKTIFKCSILKPTALHSIKSI